MKVKDLIKDKDYDYIFFRLKLKPGSPLPNDEIFIGCCKSKNGILISLDGDTYNEEEGVVSYEEWSRDGILNGLTVVVRSEWKEKVTEEVDYES